MAVAKKARFTEVELHARQLKHSFEKERWTDAVQALHEVAEIAQRFQRVDLAILAQTLRADLESRLAQSDPPSDPQITKRYGLLLEKLNYLSWAAKA